MNQKVHIKKLYQELHEHIKTVLLSELEIEPGIKLESEIHSQSCPGSLVGHADEFNNLLKTYGKIL